MVGGALQGLSMMLLNILHIPPGVTLRRSYGTRGASSSSGADGSWVDQNLANHDFINTIVDITADDVCIGHSPIYIDGLETIKSDSYREKLEEITEALNKIARWAAVDLLKYGVSVYVLRVNSVGKPNFVPIAGDVALSMSFYMTVNGEVVVMKGEAVVKDVLLFLNYSKESLIKIANTRGASELSEFLYQINPEPVQLNHVESVARDLMTEERSMYTYRSQLARIVRLCTVDVGSSQGDDTQEVIDSISASLNAPSMSFDPVGQANNFNDAITVHPHRKGIGKPEIFTDVPDFDIQHLADLDYTLSRLFLATRFPKSYADFNTALSDTAVSLIRGDIRYSRMTERARSCMEDTLNSWLFTDPSIAESEIRFKLTSLPNSEDDDVVEALRSYFDFSQDFFRYISEAETRLDADYRLQSVKVLLGDAANLQSIQVWYETMMEYIDKKFDEVEDEQDTTLADLTGSSGGNASGASSSSSSGSGPLLSSGPVSFDDEDEAVFDLPGLGGE